MLLVFVVFQIYKVLRYLCQSNSSLQNKIMSDLGELAATAGRELLRSRIFILHVHAWKRRPLFWMSRENSLELIELFSVNKVSLV